MPAFTLTPAPPQSNLFTSALSSGFHQALGNIGGTAQAVGTSFGLPGVADWGKGFAQSQQQAAQAAGRPDLEASPWYSPKGLAYRLLQGAPTFGGAVGAGALAALAVPEEAAVAGTAAVGSGIARLLGAAGFLAPQAIGENVQTAIEGGKELTSENSAKALALGLPESVLMAAVPSGKVGAALEGGVSGGFLKRMFVGGAASAAYQGVLSGAQTAVTQQNFTPDMPIADRAKQVVDSALGGGLQGAVFGGVLSAFGGRRMPPEVKDTPATDVKTEDLTKAVDAGLGKPAQIPPSEKLSPLGKSQGDYSGATNDQLVELANALTARDKDRTSGEDIQHSLVQLELARRTVPGLAPGEGVLRTPEQMDALAPQIAKMKDVALEAAGAVVNRTGGRGSVPSIPGGGEKDSFFENFNAANEPELINAITARVEGTKSSGSPKWLQTLADRFGVPFSDAGKDPAERLEALHVQEELLQKEFDAAQSTGKSQAIKAAFKPLVGIKSEIADTQRLLDLHLKASELLDPSRPPETYTEQAKPNVIQLGYSEQLARAKEALDKGADGQAKVFYARAQGLKDAQVANEKLIEQNAQTSEPSSGVPDSVPAGMGDIWRQLQAVKENVSEPKFVKASDVAQKRIEQSSPETREEARAGAQLVLNRFSNFMRPKVTTERTGAVPEPGAAGVLPREPAEAGSAVGEGHAEGNAVAEKSGAVQAKVEAGKAEAVTPETSAETVVKAANELGSNLSEEEFSGASRAGGEAQRKGFGENLNPYDWKTQPDLHESWQEGWKTAARPTHVEPTVKRAPLPKRLPAEESRAKLETYRDSGQLSPERQAMVERALASKDPQAWVGAEHALAKIESITGRPAMSSIDFNRRQTAPQPGAESPSTSWAAPAADQIYGDVVYSDEKAALVRGFNALGKPVYVPVDRALNMRGVTDIHDSKVSWLDAKTQAKLVAEADRAIAEDAKKLRENPDGPFKDATDRVVGTPNADPRVVSLVSGWLRQLGIGTRVLIVDPRDVRDGAGDKLGLHGPYQAARTAGNNDDQFGHLRGFGPDFKDAYIYLRSDLPSDLAVEIASHEVGHLVENVVYRNASPETKAAIEAAYQKWYRETRGVSKEDLIRSTRNRLTAEHLIDDRDAASTTMSQRNRDYLSSFNEWFADNVSKWATTAEKPRSVIEKFFHFVGQRLRDLMSAVRGGDRFLPDPAVKQFLDNLAAGSGEHWITERGSFGKHAQMPMLSAAERGPRTIPEIDAAAQSAVGHFEKASEVVGERVGRLGKDAPTWLRQKALIAESLEDVARIAGKFLTTARGWVDTHRLRNTISDIKNKADIKLARIAAGLTPEQRQLVDQHLAMLQNQHGLDGRKPWAYYKDLHTLANAPELRAQHEALVSDLSRLRQKGGVPAMEAVLGLMQTKRYQELAAVLHSVGETWARKGIQFEGHGVNPDLAMQFNSALHDDPAAFRKFYRDSVVTLRDGIQKHITDEIARATAFDPKSKEHAAITNPLDDLKIVQRVVNDGLTQADRGTYSPLSHGTGDFFVTAKIAAGDDGRPVPASIQALQDALDKGKWNIGVFHDTDSNTVMSRVENKGDMERLRSLFTSLQAQGHLSEINNGHPDNPDTMADLGPKYLKAVADAVNSAMLGADNVVDTATRDQVKAQLMARWMDMLPDHSLFKNLQPRKFVSGFDNDMIKAAMQRARNSSRSSTAVSMGGQFALVREAMRSEVLDNKSKGGAESLIGHDAARELWRREAEASWHVPANPLDVVRSLAHVLRIGFNPVYILTMTSQIPTLLHGELAKKYGYLGSARAIAGATGRAFKILRAIATSPDWATMGFREDALRKAGISERDIDVIMHLANSGGLSSFTPHMTELGESAEAGKWGRYKNMASAMGVFAEMIPRVVGALSAADLHGKRPVEGMTRDQYVLHVVNESQFPWGPGESSRFTSKTGPLGSFTPISLQFMAYQTKLAGKLFTELHAVLGKDGKDAQKEAGMFLATHLAAIVAIAGTMGLPLTGVFAGVADKLAYLLTGNDSFDTEGLYRTWLAHTFGPEVADVIAKGLPRAIGLDESHLGEQNLSLGTGFMQDKRKYEEAEKDWLESMAGPAFGEIRDAVLGFREIMNGDYLHGAIRIVPEGVKGLAEGYYLSKYGYVDSKGHKYPVQPSAMNIITAAIGIDPANLAQQKEAERIKTGIMAQRQFREQTISSHLVRGLLNPEAADVPSWLHQAVQFTMEHPDTPGPLGNLNNSVSRFLSSEAIAKGINMPIGVRPGDLAAQLNLGFLTPLGQ